MSSVLFANTSIGCYPNYPAGPGFSDFSVPLCSEFSYSPCIGYPVIRGEVFLDANQDGIKDSNEVNLPHKPVVFQPGNYQAYTDSNGWYSVQLDTNSNYTMTVPANFYTSTFIPTGIATGGFNQIDSIAAAGIYNDSSVNDLTIFITQGETPPRPGFRSEKQITVASNGTDTLNVTITAMMDPVFQVLEFVPVPDSIISGIAYWNVVDFIPGTHTLIYVTDSTPVGAFLGTPTACSVQVLPVNDDFAIYNNSDTLFQDIVGSYDPNDKHVSEDSILIGQLNQTNLNYRIRFQNTGTYPATFVVLKDTISGKLDLNTFMPIGASHNYTFQFNERILTVRFDNINLMDSTSNEEESHGFFSYAIEPLHSLPINDEIFNTCYIYFDYNDPIITNSTQTVIFNTIVNGWEKEKDNRQVKVWPNPGNDKIYVSGISINSVVTITDISGKSIYNYIANSEQFEINVERFLKGIYMIEIINEEGRKVVKWIKL